MMTLFLLVLIPSVFAVQYAEEQGVGFGASGGWSSLPNAEDCSGTKITINRSYKMGKFDQWLTADQGVWNGSIWNNATTADRPNLHLFTFETGVSPVGGFLNFSSEIGYDVVLGEEFWLVICRDTTGTNTLIKGTGGSGRWAESDDGGDLWKNLFSVQADFRTYSIVESPSVSNVDVYLEDKSLNLITTPFELQKFYIRGNYTIDDIENSDGVCNFTAENISAFFNKEGENKTLSTTGDILELDISESSINAVSDIISFSVCRYSVPQPNLNILVDGVIHKTLNSVIPLCTNGKHSEFNLTYEYIGDSELNISLVCSDCNGVNKRLKIIKNGENNLLTFKRKFSTHSEDMIYNITAKRYEYNNYFYTYANSGINLLKINVTCNSTIGEKTSNVLNQNLNITFLSINDEKFDNNKFIEASNNYTIIIDISNDIINSYSINVSYSNNTLIKQSTTSLNIFLNNTQINTDGIYIVDVVAIDDELNKTYAQRNFSINDTTNPIINFINPVETNNSVFIIDSQNILKINISDINLFAYNISIYDTLGVLAYNYSETNLQTTTEEIIKEITPNILGTWRLDINVSDDHTLTEIKEYDNEILKDKTINFKFDNKNVSIDYIGVYDILKTEVIKETDRYKFKYDVRYDTDKFEKEIKHKFKVSCKNIIYRENSDYTAHFVCPASSKWVDFENININKFDVVKESDDSYIVTLYLQPLEDLEFSSIGGLNIVQRTIFFEVEEESISVGLFNFNFNNVANVLLLFSLIILYIGVMSIGMFFRNIGFTSLGFFIGIVIGIILGSVHIILSLIMLFINIIIFYNLAKK